MQVFESTNYRDTLKHRMKSAKVDHAHLSWRKVASMLPIQYTYLSKALNEKTTHLNEDHLYSVCQILNLSQPETDFVLLQRCYEISNDKARRNYLANKIDQYRQSYIPAADRRVLDPQAVQDEMKYLFEPLAMIIHVALTISEYRKNPKLLCSPLGLSAAQLKQHLELLGKLNFVVLSPDGHQVQKVNQTHLFYGKDHSLMRYQQSMLKTLLISRMRTTDENHKQSFTVTFTGDQKSYLEIRKEFENFLKKIEAIAGTSKDENVFQLSYDLLQWL